METEVQAALSGVMTEDVILRSKTSADEPFLFALFSEVKGRELAVSGLAPAQLSMLLEMQYRGRCATYAKFFPEASEEIVCLKDGTPVGMLLLDAQRDHWRIVDIAVLASHRNRSIGRSVITRCQKQCSELKIPLRLNVVANNPARRLYSRLGFLEDSPEATGNAALLDIAMTWRQSADATLEDVTQGRVEAGRK